MPRVTRTAATLRARCPFRACVGTLALNPDLYGRTDGNAKLHLSGTGWHPIRVKLTPRGRRRVARHPRLELWLRLGSDAYTPVVLKRSGR